MEMKVKWDNQDQVQQGIKKNMDRLGTVVREAMMETAEETAEFMMIGVQEDILGGGNFGEEWVDAFHADITETQRTITITADMQPEGPPVTFWHVFEYGATIFAHNDKGLLTWPNTAGYSIDGKVPEFISKASVTIPKKFHLVEIVKEEAARARETFARILSESLKGA